MAAIYPQNKTQPVLPKPGGSNGQGDFGGLASGWNAGAPQPAAQGGMQQTQHPALNMSQPPQMTQPQPMAQQGGPNAQPNPYSTGNTGTPQGYNNQSGARNTSYGGVSTVNPQASMADYEGLKRFEDAAYDQSMTRLNPQMEQQSDAFDQQMVSRGIPVGSEAYNEAKQQLDFNQNDARQAAAFGAMGFGQGVQNQMFGQDAQRAGLANAMQQAKWGDNQGYAALNERGRQFDNTFGENQRQFNDSSNYRWDRAQMNDLGWLANFDRQGQQYNDQQDWNYFNANQGILGAIPGWNPAQINVAGNAGAATNSQNAAFNAQNTMNQNAWSQITDIAGMGALALASDARLKDNIQKIGEIDGLNIYTWTWNNVATWLGINKQPQIGVIAQEVNPEFVSVLNGFLAVDYEGLLNGTS